jgi:hypothetical protein
MTKSFLSEVEILIIDEHMYGLESTLLLLLPPRKPMVAMRSKSSLAGLGHLMNELLDMSEYKATP